MNSPEEAVIMICNGEYTFRKGKKGDKPSTGWLNQNDVPNFILEFRGKQIGAAHTKGCGWHIFLIETWDWDKGHGTKFVELWEKYAKNERYQRLIVSEVASDRLEHILECKRGFFLKDIDEYGEKIYQKNIS